MNDLRFFRIGVPYFGEGRYRNVTQVVRDFLTEKCIYERAPLGEDELETHTESRESIAALQTQHRLHYFKLKRNKNNPDQFWPGLFC
jgi:hypothetical protein